MSLARLKGLKLLDAAEGLVLRSNVGQLSPLRYQGKGSMNEFKLGHKKVLCCLCACCGQRTSSAPGSGGCAADEASACEREKSGCAHSCETHLRTPL